MDQVIRTEAEKLVGESDNMAEALRAELIGKLEALGDSHQGNRVAVLQGFLQFDAKGDTPLSRKQALEDFLAGLKMDALAEYACYVGVKQSGGKAKIAEQIVVQFLYTEHQTIRLRERQAEEDQRKFQKGVVWIVAWLCFGWENDETSPVFKKPYEGRLWVRQDDLLRTLNRVQKLLIEKGVCREDSTGDEDTEYCLRLLRITARLEQVSIRLT
jgi:hypothetical protein